MQSAYVPTAHVIGKNADEKTISRLKYVLKQGRPLIYANCQFDMLSLETLGIRVSEMPFYDIQTMANLVREDWPIMKSLDMLATVYLGDDEGKIKEWDYVEYEEMKNGKLRLRKESTLDWQKKNGWPTATPEMIYDYACVDTDQTYRIWEALMRHPNWKEQPKDLWDNKQKLIRVLVEMKRRGIRVDTELAHELELEGTAVKEELLKRLGGLNPSSVKDAPKIFLEKLELPVLKRTPKEAPSFTKAVLEEYDMILSNREGPQPPEVGYVKAWRGWTTAMGLLLRPYQERVSPDGRLRTSYTTHVTSTGRLSAREPNLQQISKEGGSPWNNRVKKCFLPKPGYRLLSADYSQLELRLAVAYAQEPELQAIFDEGRDIFSEMAAEMGWPRPKTKSFVYATQYGGGDARISYIFNVSIEQAKQLREKFYRKYPRFRKLDMACRSRVQETKKLKLWSGRIRHFRSAEESYKAMNALLQGGAADVVERVWVHVMDVLDSEGCRCLLQVHDALVFEVREDLVEEYREKIRVVMEDVNGICDPGSTEPLFPVRFAVDVTDWE
jgi:DNA polymerase-1|tara:strand:+ start:40830 stop:42494 length:1665 start_codon:yes stop_codon:yes gene_type:complete